MRYQYTKELLKIYHSQRRHYVVEQIVRGKTLREAGEAVGITPARARQLLAKTMRLFDESPFANEFEADGGQKPILEYEGPRLVSKKLVDIARTNSKFYLAILEAYKLLDEINAEKIMLMPFLDEIEE